MSNDIYKRNIECLERHYPMLMAEFRRAEAEPDSRPDKNVEIIAEQGRRGHPTFSIKTKDGRHITGHSIFDPMREAEKKFADCTFEEKERIVILGFGFGYEVRYVLDKIKHPVIVVFEPFVSVFRKALETVDLTDIFEAHRVMVSFSIKPQGLKYMVTAQTSHLTLPDFKVKGLPHVEAFQEFPDIVTEAVKEATTLMSFNLVTGIFAGPIIQNNIALNFPVAMKHPGINMLEGCFKDRPVFVVAPGPSLENNAEQLKKVAGKAFVIACDTAVNPLLRKGVKPDGVITIDYQPANFFKLRGVDTSFAYMFPALDVSPYIPLNHKGRMFNYYHSTIADEMFNPLLGARGTLATGGSVLTDAFSLARMMGADPIILVGVDLGFPGMRWYAEGSFDGGKFTQDLRNGKHEMVEVEDVYGNPMTTYKSFYEFITWFGLQIPIGKEKVIDATEGGAKLDGAEIMDLSDAIEKYVPQDGPSPREVMENIYSKYVPPDHEKVVDKINSLIDEFDGIHKEVSEGERHCRKAADILDTSKVLVKNKELIRRLQKINDSRKTLMAAGSDKHLGFLVPMMERQVAQLSFLNEDEDIPKNEMYKKMVDADLELYERVRKACENIASHFKIIREEILLEYDKEYV